MTSAAKTPLRILVVEDSKLQALMLKNTLLGLGMKVDTAYSLLDALSLLQRQSYDAVMLDLLLPDSHGIDTLVTVHAFHSGLPIVVITASEQEGLAEAALKSGAEDFLIKGEPTPEVLSRSLRYAIERNNQSKKLYESQKRLRATIDDSYNAFCGVDNNLKIVEWNNQAEELFGYSHQEAVEQDLIDLIFPPTNDLSVRRELHNYGAQRTSKLVKQRCEVLARHRGGREFLAEVAFFQVGQGSDSILCSFVSDITDRKASDKQGSEFYSTVSHELLGPLTSVRDSLGTLETVIGQPISDEAQGIIAMSVNNCSRLIKLVENLLDLRQYEAGKRQLRFAAASMDEVIATAIATCKICEPARKVSIVSSRDGDFRALMDRSKILQVLINLLSNAIKFSPDNGSVRVRVHSAQNGRVRVEITDQGPGIAAASLPKLFQKFPKIYDEAHAGSDGGIQGTGLGLAISKAIIVEHKGDVGVETSEGNGSTFWFEIPALGAATSTSTRLAPSRATD